MRKPKKKIVVPPGKKLVFRPWITINGRVVYASSRGLIETRRW